ncbi:hypothetical protein E2C01_100951 [Portunus trituberculatus]|uniref:Uncharacterized protein n=1 Tax=Portunus trituberculatus TaxID=210409 RepID=A0A5B7KDH8_PORTR|nr:hypothetical protein [Portunus trituberculatus]
MQTPPPAGPREGSGRGGTGGTEGGSDCCGHCIAGWCQGLIDSLAISWSVTRYFVQPYTTRGLYDTTRVVAVRDGGSRADCRAGWLAAGGLAGVLQESRLALRFSESIYEVVLEGNGRAGQGWAVG